MLFRRCIGIVIAWLAFAFLTLTNPATGQSPIPAFPPGMFQNRSALNAAGGGGGFTGVGDVVSGWKFYAGLRAFSAADRGNRLVNACNSTGGVDVGCADLSSDVTTGDLVPATVSGITCPGANCTAKILYDRSGALNCGGSACDVTSPNVSERASLVASCIGSKACLQWTATGQTEGPHSALTFTAIPQPFTFSFIFNLTSSAASADIMACPVGGVFATTDTGPNFNNFAGSTATAAISTATSYSNQSVFNGASSDIVINGTSNVVNPGTSGCATNDSIRIGWDSFNHTGTAKSGEYAILPSAMTSGQKTSVTSNQRAYWGF